MATDLGSFAWPTSGGGGGGVGVTSLNTLTGAVNLVAGDGITITPSGNTLTVANDGTPVVQLFTLASGDITNGYVTLSSAPLTPNETVLEVRNAGAMFYGADFSITGSQLSWNGLALNGILSVGDQLTVSFIT